MIIKKGSYENSNYTILDNKTIRDTSLSLTSRGLLHFMLSCNPDWKFSIDGLCKATNTKLAKLNTCLKELMNAGYVKKEIKRDINGKILGFEWIVSETRNKSDYNTILNVVDNIDCNDKGYVYVLKTGEYYKIGITSQPNKRFSSITMLPYEINLLFMFYVKDYLNVETYLHRYFSDKNVKGEWFKLDEKDIIFIKNYLLEIKCD